MNERKRLGNIGEKLALKELKRKGYKILATNYNCKIGEIDIIAKDDDTLVFIEVRTRKGDSFGLPEETVNFPKQRKLRKVAQCYLLEHNLIEINCRFDIVGIVWKDGILPEINLIKDAF